MQAEEQGLVLPDPGLVVALAGKGVPGPGNPTLFVDTSLGSDM